MAKKENKPATAGEQQAQTGGLTPETDLQALKAQFDELADPKRGEYIVVKKEPFAKLLLDLSNGYTNIWTGGGGKKRLLEMIGGVEDKATADDLYLHIRDFVAGLRAEKEAKRAG